MRKNLLFAAVATTIMVFAMPAAAVTWKCSAPRLVNGSYDGGSTLSGYGRGGTYPVKRKGRVTRGTTKNGTKFTCRQVR